MCALTDSQPSDFQHVAFDCQLNQFSPQHRQFCAEHHPKTSLHAEFRAAAAFVWFIANFIIRNHIRNMNETLYLILFRFRKLGF